MVQANTLALEALELQNNGRVAEAAELFNRILAENANDFVALYSLAVIASNAGDPARALEYIERAIRTNPAYAPSYHLRGGAQHALKRHQEALASFDLALKLDPDSGEAHINKGVLLHELKRHQEALACFDRALAINPANPVALGNRGILLTELNRNQEAAGVFERLLEASPDYDYGRGLLAYARLHCCDWTGFEEDRRLIAEGLRAGKRICKSLALLAISDSAEDQLKCARIFGRDRYPPSPAPAWSGQRYEHERIRVAYVSPDFREHPVGHLTAGIFERHDRTRFETIGISLGVDDGSRLGTRIRSAFDRFIDVRARTSREIAQLMVSLEVDIAVDLAGYTADSRTDIFAHRAAPIQVNWLGYPGTLGLDYIDYILADRHVIPQAHRSWYAEKVVSLPDSYLPTDAGLKVADRTPTRGECGLPETGIVFCSFNHDYKIGPEVFAVWMRLLARVEGSVLWLMKLNQAAQDNLCAEAARHGIDPRRLVFATRVPSIEDHLARYRQADLFLDTYPYNAHTTAADALFAGLPVVTYMGNSFQGRVAGSLLHSIGLPELATASLEAYEALAMKLATGPHALTEVKNKLAGNRSARPLFDTGRFCRNIEAAYAEMWNRHRQGLAPDHFSVAGADRPGPQTGAATGALRLHIGGTEVKQGWKILNVRPGDGVDFVGDIQDLSRFPDASVQEIYASHVLEHVSQAAALPALKGLHRVLKPGGRVMISVPDLETLCRLFLLKGATKELRFHVMRMMFGGQIDSADFHYIGYNYEFLADFLTAAGFARIERVESFGLFNDTSDFAPYAVPISLNVIAHKA